MRRAARLEFAMPLAAATLGAGALLWGTAIARWRAAVVGTLGWPALEQLLAGVMLLGGGAAGLWLSPARLGRLRIGALLVTAAGTALAAVAWLPPALAATPAGAGPTVALPLCAIGLAASAMLGSAARERAERAGQLVAAIAGGGAAALLGLRLQAAATWFSVLAAAALLLVLAGAALPSLPRRDPRGAAGSPAPLPSAALPLGTILVLAAQRAATPTVAWWPSLLVLLFALAAWLGTLVPAHHRHRLAAVAIAVLAAGVGAATPFRALGADLVAPACAAGLLAAGALGGGRDAGGRVVIALLLGALLAGVAVTVDAPPPLAIGLAALVPLVRLLRATAVAFAALAVALAVPVVRTATATTARAHEVLLARAGPADALYRARTQDVVVAFGSRDLDRRGPDRPHAALLAALARAFADTDAGPVVLLGSGTGRVAELFADLGPEHVLAVEPCAAVAALQQWLAVDGPVPPRRLVARGDGCAMGSREFAWSVAAGSCAALVCAEPLSAAAPARAACEEHAALRNAARDGAVLQAFQFDATPPDLLATALAAAAAVHPWCGVFVSGNAGAIVGLAQAPDWSRAAARLDRLPDAVRWALHEAGIGSIGDCADALLGVLPPPANVRGDDAVLATADALDGGDDAAAAAACAEVLRTALGAAAAPGTTAATRLALRSAPAAQRDAALVALLALARARPDGVLLAREGAAALRADAERRIAAADPQLPEQVADAAALAARFAHVGCPSAVLQAALALAPRRGESVRTQASAGRAALALDPGFAAVAPPVLAPIVAGLPARSPLADFAQLPAGDQLAELATGDSTLAIALRARVPSRVAAALVARWQQRPLPLPALAVLRELADPFVLDRAARVLAARAAPAELLQIWRKDLPATAAVRALADGPAAQRQALQVAIAGRTDPDSLDLVRQGLVDGDLAVRTAAGAALFRSIGDRIVYDPEWPAERRTAAAAELAALYPRTPR